MKSYLRFLSRNKLYTAIMAVGLSVSMALVIMMSCYVWQNISVNRYYPDQDRMYAVGNKGDVMSNLTVAQIMAEAVPEIESATSIMVKGMQTAASIEDKPIERKSFMGVRAGFFDMFPMTFFEGSPEVLNDVNNVIITKSLAEKFGINDVIGKKMYFRRDSSMEPCELTIAAVVDDFDDTIFANEQIIVNIDNHHVEPGNRNFYGTASGYITVIKVRDGCDIPELLSKMDSVFEKGLPESRRGGTYLELTCLNEIYTSDNNEGGHTGFKKGNSGVMTAFSIIVVFLLISSIFNYINLSIALSGRRSKEIATRMLLGENSSMVFARNLYESFGFIATCMASAFILAKISMPYVNMLLESPIPIEMRFSHEYIYMYLVIFGIVALFCGIMPTLLTLGFKPIEIIKGNFRFKRKRLLSKAFIIIQNSIAIIIIATALVMSKQIRYMIDMPLNANIEGLYLCRAYSSRFEKTLRELPYVSHIGRSQGRPGEGSSSFGFLLNDDMNSLETVRMCYCDSTAFSLYGFKIVRDYGVPEGKGPWLTESAMKKLEIDPENPVFPHNASWVVGNKPVAGIIEDVPLSSALDLDTDVTGIVMLRNLDLDPSDYVVKLTGATSEEISELSRLCNEEMERTYGPNAPISSGYISDLIEKRYESLDKQLAMVTLFMIIAIMLSSLGQIAMSTYYAIEMEKEIGVRKVFGSTVWGESIRNIWKYMLYSLMACAIGIPVAVLIAERYLETFVYRMSLKPWIFIVATASMLAVSLLSVLWQTLRAARTNPAEALKKE